MTSTRAAVYFGLIIVAIAYAQAALQALLR